MPDRESRTYKLCLSEAGLNHFLDCHGRVGRGVRDLVPYGATLFIALAIADTMPSSRLAAELSAPTCAALLGRTVHFVGFTGHLARLTDRLCARLAASGGLTRGPRVNCLYVAGLSLLDAAKDGDIVAAYRQIREIRKEAKS